MSDAEKPVGAASDFRYETLAEREKRLLAGQNLNDAEQEFRREQDQLAKQKARIEKERKKAETARNKKPANMRYLLVARMPAEPGVKPPFKVVGFYTTRALLSENLVAASLTYAEIGASLGVVDFDLTLKQDQPVENP